MENTQKKRGRGRPRKAAPEPERERERAMERMDEEPIDAVEILMPSRRVDTSDLHASPPSVPGPVEPEIEVINLGPPPEPEPAPPPPPRPAQDVLEMLRTAPSSPMAPPADDKATRRELLGKIKKYRESFPAVAAMRFSEEWSAEELESHLENIRVAVSAKTTGVLVKNAYILGVKGLEVGGTAVGLKVYGLSDLLSRSAEIDSILKEIQCELPVLARIGPGHRLALATFGAALALDSANRKAEVLGNFKSAPVAEAVSNKYKDL